MNSKISGHDEVNKGLHALLSHPTLYNLFGRLIGMPDKYRLYVNSFIKPFKNMKLLDIGCGTGAILDFLPRDICYVGYDINSVYIDHARRKYGHRAEFHNKRVNEMTLLDPGKFDVILADGLIHHLNDSEARNLFQIGYRSLNDNGFMLTLDPVFVEKQNPIDRFIISMDRGQHIKYHEEYKKVAESSFSNILVYIVQNVGMFSLTGCILKCCKE